MGQTGFGKNVVIVPTAVISVSRRNLVQDFAHQYSIFVDGVEVGSVAPYRTAQFEVTPGWHRVWARLPSTGSAALGDVVLRVGAAEVRCVRTTSRLKRLTPWQLVRAVVATVLGVLPFPLGPIRLAVDLVPRIVLRPAPGLEQDRDPPPSVGLMSNVEPTAAGIDPIRRALAEHIRDATFDQQRGGYSTRDVDAHLESLAATLDAGGDLDPADRFLNGFKRARLGYRIAQVDEFLSELRGAADSA